MRFVIMGEAFDSELRPLVKSFYQNDNIEVEQSAFDESLAWPVVQNQKLMLSSNDNEEILLEPFDFDEEDALIIHLGISRFHIAVLHDNRVMAFEEVSNVPTEHKCYRNTLARCIYRLLSKVTGYTLPWGILTGVRPTKLVVEAVENGDSEQNIRKFIKEEYYCSEEKIDMSFSVAKRELALLSGIDYKQGYSLYIGIPFCPTTCSYCSFTSFPLAGFKQYVEPYLEALFREIEFVSKSFANRKPNTIYIGGGTPTTLSAEQLRRLLCLVNDRFDLSACREFTVEAGRPDSITRDKLVVLKQCGANRISINPQTMNNKTLEAIGRRHSAEQVEEAFALARECGYDNINMDLIIGLTGETPDDVKMTLRRIEAMNPDSLTVHTLALKRAARLNITQQKFRDIGAENVTKMLRLTSQYAKEHQYYPYYLYRQKNMSENLENVGYSHEGKEGLYNVLIMEEKQSIIAVGAGGMSKFVFHGENNSEGIRIERVETVKNLIHYIERIDEMTERKKRFLEENMETLFTND